MKKWKRRLKESFQENGVRGEVQKSCERKEERKFLQQRFCVKETENLLYW
jgi:hypothetical protein